MVNSKGKKLADNQECNRTKIPGNRLRDTEDDDDEKRGMSVASLNTQFRHDMGIAVDNMLSKLSTLRQSANHNKPAELFRKDLISAMKLPDSEILNADDYYDIRDGWRQEWEKGVQVPVNPDTLHSPSVAPVGLKHSSQSSFNDFKMPKKYLHSCQDENYKQGLHELTRMQQLADQVVRYDLDDQDVAWLDRVNQDRFVLGELNIDEWTMERVMESLETQCHENLQDTIRNSEGLGIEYDEDVICDVCRSPDSEETNEMVFCDKCDICIHQACYGIQSIPEGSWLCRTCALGVQPNCILCPNKGGAMKSTKSGTKWCHVSCALWIPEVSIGCVETMEPITKISQVPSSRWELICTICRERHGACIQCSVKSCKTAFHVTCAFTEGLDMKTILGDEHEEIKLKGYCPKHSKMRTGSDGLPISNPCSPRKEYTKEEQENFRLKKIKQIEDEFYTCVDVQGVATGLDLAVDVVQSIYEYWKLKRRVNFNRPLLMPKTEEADLLSKQQEDSLITKMKMFVHLRQDLERVRNLCYMVSRREKTRRSLYKMKEAIFNKQLQVVLGEMVVSSRELQKILVFNHAADVYDNPEYILQAAKRFDDNEERKPIRSSPPSRKSPVKHKNRAVSNGSLSISALKSSGKNSTETLVKNERDGSAVSKVLPSVSNLNSAQSRNSPPVSRMNSKSELVDRAFTSSSSCKHKSNAKSTSWSNHRRRTTTSPPRTSRTSLGNGPSCSVDQMAREVITTESETGTAKLVESSKYSRGAEASFLKWQTVGVFSSPELSGDSDRSRPARNLMHSFQKIELEAASALPESRPPKFEKLSYERKVEPLRVTIPASGPLACDSDSALESDDSSVLSSSTSHSGTNGFGKRPVAALKRKLVNGDRHWKTSPAKSPVKCTLISPGKLKLTLKDVTQTEPIKKSEVCESFVRHRNSSPYKSDSASEEDNNNSKKSSTRNSTVSVMDMLRLRRDCTPKSEQSYKLSDSDSGQLVSKKRRLDSDKSRESERSDNDSDTSRSSSRRSNSSRLADLRTRFLRRINQQN